MNNMAKNTQFSPLRYPGGKAKFAPFIKSIIEKNGLYQHYVEPYAGGAGVALDLLFSGYCTDIHINDIDVGIYNFWNSTIKETDSLLKLIYDTPINIEEWHKQKIIFNNPCSNSPLLHGFATFFLNRTNRSGILKAGVIGGIKQSGTYKLDCRFNKTNLIKRIENIGKMGNHIHTYNKNTEFWLEDIDKTLPKNSLIYLDPPYYVKGKGLYRNFYNHNDHIKIYEILKKIVTKWVVSYDNHPNIRDIYHKHRIDEYILNYSASSRIKGCEIIIYSNDLII